MVNCLALCLQLINGLPEVTQQLGVVFQSRHIGLQGFNRADSIREPARKILQLAVQLGLYQRVALLA